MEGRNFLRGAALAGTGAALATPAVSGGHGTVLTGAIMASRFCCS